MQKSKLYSDYRAVIFTLLIILVVTFSGVILYKNLSKVSSHVNESIKTFSPASIISKQIIVELRTAENTARTYKLTGDISYIEEFYNVIPKIENDIILLKKISFKCDSMDVNLINNIIDLSRDRLELTKAQLYIEDPVAVTNELNLISQKIEETYKQSQEKKLNAITIQKADTIKKKKGFFKRFFGKNEANEDSNNNKLVTATVTSKTDIDPKTKLKNTVLKVKNNQAKLLANYKKTEYQINQEGLILMDKINKMADALKLNEDVKDIKRSNILKAEVNEIKLYSIIFSIVIALFLFMLINLIRNYVRKKSEYEFALLDSKNKAEDLAKTKETFLANMSHEIKTPLNAIYGFTEQLLSSELKPEQIKQLNIVKNSASYLTKLVNNILTYAKLQAGKSQLEITSFNFETELNEIQALFEIQAKKKGVNFTVIKSENLPKILKSDVNKIKQILFNIIGNALKFTNKGGVKVTVNFVETNHHKNLEICVEDTGIGIDENKLTKLFNEYEQGDTTTHKKYGGTGLGLVITKQIVEQLSGNITINSEVASGTTVNVILPIEIDTENKPLHKNNSLVKNCYNYLKGKSILIVDDEEFNRLLLKSIFKKFDISISEAHNGNEAIELIKNKQFDLVIMDIRMPEKNGLEATSEIRLFDKKLPILASTAVVSEEKIAKCMQVGVSGIVFKPFTENELLVKIIEVLFIDNQSKSKETDVDISTNKIINLDNLNEYSNNDDVFKKEMIQLFHKSINKGFTDIEKLHIVKDYIQISEIAHKLIPACKHFDAKDLCSNLKYFERIKTQFDVNAFEINSKFTELKKLISNINRELKPYV